jgi:hypothetical protein
VKLNYIAIIVLTAMCVWMAHSWWRFGGGLLLFAAVFSGVLALSILLIDLRKTNATK